MSTVNKRQHPQTGSQRHPHHRHHNHRYSLSSSPPSLLHLLFLTITTILVLILPTPTSSQVTWEQSNDPTNLCSPSRTGYRATLDCRGFVYCNDGYLQGGGVIPCRPNQLYDEDLGTCTYWQQVDRSKCPEFDGSFLMPEDKDENANEKRFFCGASASNAKQVCEPCPGGSRLECSDIAHNCYAGITGCRSSSANKPKPSTTTTTNNNINNDNSDGDDGNPLGMETTSITTTSNSNSIVNNIVNNNNVPDPTPLPTPLPMTLPTPLPTRLPTEFPTRLGSLTSPTKKPTPRPISKIESSYYCGFEWDWVVDNCASATPCPYGDAFGICEGGMICIANTPCGDVNTGMPTKKPTPMPTKKPTPIPTKKPTPIPTKISYPPVKGDDPTKRYCGYNWEWVKNNCAQTTPCPSGDSDRVCPLGMRCFADTPCRDINNGMPTPKPTPIPTRISYPPVKGDDPAKRFCGINWADVTANCLTAVPCPSGYAQGVCPNNMNCIAETQCASETYLQYLRDKQANNGSGKDFVQSKPSSPTGSVVPAVTAPIPPTEIATTLDNNISISNGSNPSNQPTNPPSMNPTLIPSAKPIRMSTPSDPVARDPVDPDVSSSTTEMSASTTAKPTPLPVPLSQLPLASPSAPSAQLLQTAPPVPSSQLPQTTPSTSSPYPAPTTALPSKSLTINTNFCGISWADHTIDCAKSLPCPKGDECAPGESCFNGSLCAMLNIDISPGDASSESNVGNFCGTEWNELMLMCKSATECTRDGNECAEGEFCYQDFVCDPPSVTTTTTAAISPSTAATALAAMNDRTEINPTLSLGSDASLILNVGKETNQGQPAPGQEEIPSQIILGDSTIGISTSPQHTTKSPPAKYPDFDLSSSASPYMVPVTTVCLSAAVALMITW